MPADRAFSAMTLVYPCGADRSTNSPPHSWAIFPRNGQVSMSLRATQTNTPTAAVAITMSMNVTWFPTTTKGAPAANASARCSSPDTRNRYPKVRTIPRATPLPNPVRKRYLRSGLTPEYASASVTVSSSPSCRATSGNTTRYATCRNPAPRRSVRLPGALPARSSRMLLGAHSPA